MLLALHGAQILFTTRVLDATLGSFLVAALAIACDRLEPGAPARRFALAGLLVGLLALLRSTALVFAPVVLVAAWRCGRVGGLRARVRDCAAFALLTAIPIAPVTLRNVASGGEPVLLTSSGGVNFLIGNARGSDGRFTSLNHFSFGRGRFDDDPTDGRFELSTRRFAEAVERRSLSARETSRFYARLAREDIAAAPLGWAALLARKLFLFVNSFEVPQIDNLYFLARAVPWLGVAAESSRLLWPLALFGLLLGARDASSRRRAALFAAYAAAIALFFVTDRYRLWITPIAAWFAGAAVARLAAVVRSGTPRSRAGHAAALGAAAILCNLDPSLGARDPAAPERQGLFGWFERPAGYLDFRAQHNNLAARLLAKGDAEASLAECEAGLALAPSDPTLTLNRDRALEALATGHYRRGDHARARSVAERWASAAPDSPEAWNTLGAALFKLEEGEAGLAAMRRAAQLAPRELRYPLNLGLALLRMRRFDESAVELDAVLRLQPDHAGALLARAEVFLETGERSKARALLERVLARLPDQRRARELLERCRD